MIPYSLESTNSIKIWVSYKLGQGVSMKIAKARQFKILSESYSFKQLVDR